MIRVVFLGNWGLGARSLEIIAAHPEFRVVKVITRFDSATGDPWFNRVWETAGRLGLSAWNYMGKKKTDVSAEIRKAQPDLLLSASYSKILSGDDLRAPRLGAVNIHPSLLPEYRGADPLSLIIANRDRVAGQTAHFMDEGVDTGDIIDSESFQVSAEPTRMEILEKHNRAVEPLLGRVLGYFAAGRVPRVKQEF